MLTIFYDLETSDRHRVAQIISFSFICVDDNFKVVDEFSEIIKISRLQLPSPQAVLVNRLDAQKHQQSAKLNEKEAMFQISRFIEKQIADSGQKVVFLGFNSSRFDLPFLRTSLIRNGLDPYFKGKLIYKDLLFAARKLSISRKDFPRAASASADPNEPPRLSLSLETLSRELGILKGAQSHDAREDVLLSIELAKCFKKKFGLDVRAYDSYEARSLHGSLRKGTAYNSLYPNYDLNLSEIAVVSPVTLLDADHRYSLWIDLGKFRIEEERECINWISQSGGALYIDPSPIKDSATSDLAVRALDKFKSVNLKNYFETSTCDIEQDIYRLDISAIDVLADAIWRGKRERVDNMKNRDIKVVLLRHDLANYEWGGKFDAEVEKLLQQYADYRYSGKIALEKFTRKDAPVEKHSTLEEMLSDIEKLEASAESKADKQLMHSLREFYLKSDVYRVLSS